MRFLCVLNFNKEKKKSYSSFLVQSFSPILSINGILIEFIEIIDIRIFNPFDKSSKFFQARLLQSRFATRHVTFHTLCKKYPIRNKKKKRKEDRRKHLSIGNNSPVLPYLKLFKKKNGASHRLVKYGRSGSFLNEITLRAPLKRCKY